MRSLSIALTLTGLSVAGGGATACGAFSGSDSNGPSERDAGAPPLTDVSVDVGDASSFPDADDTPGDAGIDAHREAAAPRDSGCPTNGAAPIVGNCAISPDGFASKYQGDCAQPDAAIVCTNLTACGNNRFAGCATGNDCSGPWAICAGFVNNGAPCPVLLAPVNAAGPITICSTGADGYCQDHLTLCQADGVSVAPARCTLATLPTLPQYGTFGVCL